jgi:hypothetical protein
MKEIGTRKDTKEKKLQVGSISSLNFLHYTEFCYPYNFE